MARSKPQTNFYINYGPVTTTGNTDALIPVFIAPRYGLHGSAYGDGEFGTTYSGAAISASWPNRDENSVIDQSTAAVVFDNPVVGIGGSNGNPLSSVTTHPASSGGTFYNSVTFGGAVAGSGSILFGGYQLRPGDKLELTKGSSSVVYGVNNVIATGGTVTTSVTSANISSGGLSEAPISGAVTIGSSYDNKTKLVYAIYPTSIFVANNRTTMQAKVVNIAGDPGFPPQVSMNFPDGTPVVVGNKGMSLSFGVSGSTEYSVDGSTFLATVNPPSATALNTAVLDDSVDSGLRSSDTVVRVQTANIVNGAVKVDANYVDINADTVSVAADAKVTYGDITYDVVSCEKVYAEYRDLLQDDVGEITTGARSDIESWIGELNPDNPLGMCYAAAINAGTPNFFLLPVGEESDEAYISALQVAGKLEAAYALYPLRQTAPVIAAAKGIVSKYSDKSVAQFKRLWLYAQDKQMSEVKLNGVDTPLAAITSDGQLNLESGSFTGSAVKAGTKAVLHSVYNATTQTTSDITVTITEIIDNDSAKVKPVIGVPTPAVVSFYNGLTPSKYAEEIAASATAQSNLRINYVYAEENTVNGYSFEDARYIVPVLMAMRSANAPHAPLTDLAIPGVTIGDAIGFSESDYDIMNNGGVWVCYRDNRGENVSRHAITTGGEGTIAEEDSAVSNGDNIVRFIRNSLQYLRGNCNVTPQLINQIDADARAALAAIMSRTYNPLIGPQILEVVSVSIKQDPNNTAGVIGTFDLDLPDVYLNGDFTFNLN